jgi:tol-pal system protein YbgF
MNVRLATRVVVLSGLAGLVGCATGGSQVENSIYDTQRVVRDLQINMQPTLQRLNQSTVELEARLNDADEQTRTLQGLMQENQVRLDEMQRKLDEVQRMVAGDRGISVPRQPPPVREIGTPGTGEHVIMRPPEPARPPVTPIPEPVEEMDRPPLEPRTGLSPGNETIEYENARSSYRNENYELAIQQFNEFMRRYPDSQYSANAQYWKAHSHGNLGQYADAVREFSRLRALHPTSSSIPLAMYNEAAALTHLGRIAEAEALLERLVREHPDHAAAATAREDLRKIRGN